MPSTPRPNLVAPGDAKTVQLVDDWIEELERTYGVKL
jgi:hypothetical protein